MISYSKLLERYKYVMEERKIIQQTIRQLKKDRDIFKYKYEESKKELESIKKELKEQDIIIDMLYQQVYKKR
jgi:hypothetical protein